MALLTVDQLFTAASAADIRAKLVAQLVVANVPADKWAKGGVFSTILTVVSYTLAMFSSLIATIIQGFFLPTSTGGSLKLLAYYGYGVTVPDASFASGNVVLTNSGGGVYTKGVGEYLALNPTTKQTYQNTAPFTLGALAILTVPMAAVNAGSVGSAVPHSITDSVTSLLGVTVTNPSSFVGIDAPDDPAIRQLAMNKLGSLSVYGVRSVYAYSIQTAINPVTLGPVNINRWAISESSHFGTVTMTVAAPSGPPDANDILGIQTQVEKIARASGVLAVVQGAVEVDYTANVIVWVFAPSGTSADSVKLAVEEEISAYLAAYPIGGIVANDDTVSNFQGLFGPGVVGAIEKGAANVSAKVLSVKGASDLGLTDTQVAVDQTSVQIIIVPQTSGVLS